MEPLDPLKNLNNPQRRAVTAGTGQVLVLAGPGSGKTRVLTQRIAYLITHMGVQPQHILAVTFTNKAAREMEHRLESLLPGQVQGIWLGTFHANCARILRVEAEHLPFDRNFVIMDADDQLSIVRRAIKDLNVDDKTFRPAGIHAAISKAKNNLITVEDFPTNNYRDEVTRRIYERYQALLRSSNAVDFDDLMLETVRLLVDQPQVREKYARRFEHVLVDEFQDTNLVQYELLKLLSSGHRNIFVVGDEDQSIYRWRGADYKNVLKFEEDYPDTQKILLEQNYRSTQTVLNAAQGIINRNKYRTPKKLYTDRGSGEVLTLYEAEDDRAEADYVVETIRSAVNRRLEPAGNFAVMYRTNAQSRLLEEAFLRNGMAYRLVGAQRFYGRREVKDIIAYLRLAHNPRDEVSLDRIINVPARGIGDKTILALKENARIAGISPGEYLIQLASPAGGKTRVEAAAGRGEHLLAGFGRMLARWISAAEDSMPLPALFDQVVADTGYQSYVDDGSEEGTERWENVQELRRIAYEYSDRGLTAFLENLALVSDQDTLPEEVSANAPTLLTLHAAKGLEFPQVFIIGLDDGLLPHARSKDDAEEMAEERRLLYVGITRAKDRVYLVRANRRSTFGGYDDQLPSPFLDDIPEELVQRQGFRRPSWDSGYGQSFRGKTWNVGTNGIQRNAPAASPVMEQRYHPSDHVRHPIFGEGIVMDSRLQDDDETVDVYFESVGFKRVAASLAKLEILPKNK